MNRPQEFVPVGQTVARSERLELAFDVQRQFIHELQQTATELEASPFVTPDTFEAHLGRIALLDDSGKRSRDDVLHLHFSETKEGLRNAQIDTLDDGQRTRYMLAPQFSTWEWEVWQPHEKQPTSLITTENLAAIIGPKIARKEVRDELLDTPNLQAMDVPHILYRHLHRSARRRHKRLTYGTVEAAISGADIPVSGGVDPTLLSSAASRLMIFGNGNRTQYNFSVSAPYELNNTTITKTYGYQAETNGANVVEAQGAVTISSSDGYSPRQIDHFAVADPNRREAMYGLQRGLSSLRRAYNLEEEIAA